jgi:ATP-dependent DNA ligase
MRVSSDGWSVTVRALVRLVLTARRYGTALEMRERQWVKPELVAQIRFVEWTAEGRLRHAAFLGLRSDKSAREVQREANGMKSSAR